jgi:hypothetical protein
MEQDRLQRSPTELAVRLLGSRYRRMVQPGYCSCTGLAVRLLGSRYRRMVQPGYCSCTGLAVRLLGSRYRQTVQPGYWSCIELAVRLLDPGTGSSLAKIPGTAHAQRIVQSDLAQFKSSHSFSGKFPWPGSVKQSFFAGILQKPKLQFRGQIFKQPWKKLSQICG